MFSFFSKKVQEELNQMIPTTGDHQIQMLTITQEGVVLAKIHLFKRWVEEREERKVLGRLSEPVVPFLPKAVIQMAVLNPDEEVYEEEKEIFISYPRVEELCEPPTPDTTTRSFRSRVGFVSEVERWRLAHLSMNSNESPPWGSSYSVHCCERCLNEASSAEDVMVLVLDKEEGKFWEASFSEGVDPEKYRGGGLMPFGKKLLRQLPEGWATEKESPLCPEHSSRH